MHDLEDRFLMPPLMPRDIFDSALGVACRRAVFAADFVAMPYMVRLEILTLVRIRKNDAAVVQ